jgi:hypothetical protein
MSVTIAAWSGQAEENDLRDEEGYLLPRNDGKRQGLAVRR